MTRPSPPAIAGLAGFHARLVPVAVLLLGPLLASGCKLVDQRTFLRHADAPPRVKKLTLPAGRTVSSSLVAIAFPSPPDAWAGPLKVAVGLAVARKPDVMFTVRSVVPATGTPAEQADALARATVDARAVADSIEADGVDRGQIELVAGTDAGVRHEEIRVLVR